MKNITSLLITLACTTAAFAGNDGPQGQAKLPVQVLAESRSGGGLTPPNAIRSSLVQISTDGSVKATFFYQSAPTKTVSLATLSASVTAKLVANVSAAVAGNVVDDNPNGGCQDAPFSHYSVTKADGEKVEIAQTAHCRSIQKDNLNAQEAQVLAVLKGFDSVVALVRP